METLDDAFWICGLGGLLSSLMFFTPLWAPQLVFRRPSPAPHPRAEAAGIPRFFIADGFVLTAWLAAASAIIASQRNAMNQGWVLFFAASASVFVIMVWMKSLRFMQQYQVRRLGPRIIVQTVLYPTCVVLVGEVAFTAMVLASMLFEMIGKSQGFIPILLHPLTLAAACLLTISIGALFVVRFLFQRLLA